MKKNKVLLLGIITVFVAIFSLTLVSGTWAKYTSTVSGADTAKVAKWAWNVNDADLTLGTTTGTVQFNLFDTVLDTATGNDGNTDTDVKLGTETPIIAPGTKGSFELKVTNASEVNGTLKVELAQSGATVPLKFSTNGTAYVSLAELNTSLKSTAVGSAATETITIYWMWAFEGAEGTDATDTTLGIAGETVTVNATLTFTQVD